MANVFDAVHMPSPLHAVTVPNFPIASGTATGLFAPGEEPSLTGIPEARAREDQTFPEGREIGGAGSHSYSEDFYYRMHILPSLIDVGNLTEKATYTIEVFNAFLETVSITEIGSFDAEGLMLSGFDLPEAVLALTSVFGELLVAMDGPPRIDGRFVFEFTEGEPVTLRVTGSRIVTFSVPPDWSRKVVERLSYWTDVLEARDGTEQRIRMRRLPRWSMEYGILESGETLNLLDSMLAGWGARTFLVPVWWMKSALDRPLLAGEVSAECHTEGRGFAPGSPAVVWQDAHRCEAVEVLSVSPGSVTFANPVGQEFEEGYLIPAKMCRMTQTESSLGLLTSSLAEATLAFEAEEPEDTPPAGDGDMLEGKDVFPFRHDWTSQRKRSVSWSLNMYDSGTGLPVRTPRRNWPTDSLEARDVLFGTIAEANAFKAWVARAGARAGSFWALIEEEQLLPSRGIEAGTTLIYVKNAAYGLLVSETACRNRLFLRTADGERLVFRVTSYMETEGGDFLLFTDRTWPRSVPVGQISRIGFVVLCRLDQDDFEIERRQDLLGRTSLSLRGVQN
ncbi:MAG: hypothetical protein LBT40_12550 [Deltaproteobacteria bacterium]|jgi:hypothetical protein|nr:hypothetical protein [Deltaproteobacteria bacterium]